MGGLSSANRKAAVIFCCDDQRAAAIIFDDADSGILIQAKVSQPGFELSAAADKEDCAFLSGG